MEHADNKEFKKKKKIHLMSVVMQRDETSCLVSSRTLRCLVPSWLISSRHISKGFFSICCY